MANFKCNINTIGQIWLDNCDFLCVIGAYLETLNI